MAYLIQTLTLPGSGVLGIGAMPKRADFATIRDWRADAILTMTTRAEFSDLDFQDRFGGLWHHLPIADYGTLDAAGEAAWRDLSPGLHEILARKGRVFAHCMGGKGRSGMVLLRLMVEQGIEPGKALADLREIRAGAVETEAQRRWAIKAD